MFLHIVYKDKINNVDARNFTLFSVAKHANQPCHIENNRTRILACDYTTNIDIFEQRLYRCVFSCKLAVI